VPSPIGHALGATAAGWLVARPCRVGRALVVQTAILAAVGAAPDLDLLIGRHSNETHSLGAALIVAALAAWWRWPVADSRWRVFLTIFAAWFSHPVLDAFAADSSPPFGVMLLWPFSSAHIISAWTIFDSIYRNWHEAIFFPHNFHAALKEILILLPVTAVVYWFRKPAAGSRGETIRIGPVDGGRV
jgi:membrane-bound metal-dependent hydrolase YbcI (DUF457 family)